MPVLAEIAKDYQDEVTFVAVAGRASLERTQKRAKELFGDRLLWGLDESVWQLYGVFGQPTSILITGNDQVVDGFFIENEETIREKLDALVELGV